MRDTARRGGRLLPPTANPAIGDVLTINGLRHRLIEVATAGRGSGTRLFHFRDETGAHVWITARKRGARA